MMSNKRDMNKNIQRMYKVYDNWPKIACMNDSYENKIIIGH